MAVAKGSASVSDQPTSSVKPPIFYRFLEGGGIIGVLGLGMVSTLGMLLLSIRDTRRMERVNGLLKSAEKLVNGSPQVVGLVGRVYTAGKYKVGISTSKCGLLL